MLWELLFSALHPCAGEPGVGLGPSQPRGNAEISLLVLNHHMVDVGPAIPLLCPSYLSWHGFFMSLVVGVPLSSISGGSQ